MEPEQNRRGPTAHRLDGRAAVAGAIDDTVDVVCHLAALAGVEMAEGAVDAAKSHATEALAIYRAGGHRRGEAAVGPLLASLAGPSSGGL